MTSSELLAIKQRLQRDLHEAVKDLRPADYRTVLEDLHCEIEARLECLDEEEKDAEDQP